MFWYVKTAIDELVFGDNEFAAWQRETGLPKATVTARKQAQDAVDAAVKVAPVTDVKNPPKQVADAQTALKAVLASEVPAQKVVRDKVQISLTGALLIVSWDGHAPNVDMVLGVFPAQGIPFMGWPQTDVPPEIEKGL